MQKMKIPWYLLAKNKGGVSYKTTSGPVVSINDAVAAPLRSLVANIDPVQAGTGDPSPDNVRPISGWSAVNVWRTGANIWDEQWESGQFNGNTSTGVIGKVQDSTRIRTVNDFPVMPLTTYYVHSPQPLFAYFLDENKTWLNRVGSNGTTLAKNATFTTPENCRFIKFFTINTPTYNDISINYPSTDHDYHAYTGNTYTIQLGQTVYGGTLDVTNGVLTVDRYLYVYDGTESFSKSSTALNGFYNNLIGITPHDWPKMWNYNLPVTPISSEISSMFKMTRNADTYRENYGYCYLDSGMNFNCNPDLFGTTVASFKAKLAEFYESGTPVSVFVKTRHPITIPLTPQEISTLQGQNNVWADSGDVTVEYLASGGANPDLMKLAVAFMGRK